MHKQPHTAPDRAWRVTFGLIAFLVGWIPVVAAQESVQVAKESDALVVDKPPELAVLRSVEDAAKHAARVTGFTEAKDLTHSVKRVVLDKDNTPYLADRLVGRELWCVTYTGWSIEPLDSSLSGGKDWYTRTVDVLLDPTNGRLLKIKSRWPSDVVDLYPEASAASATRQLQGSDKEKYHGFPSEPPAISFVDAVEAVQEGGGNPRAAKQIVGQWVLWSKREKPPRPMWVITLRGIPPIDAGYPGVPEYLRDHLRLIVDPVARKWVSGSTSPQPDIPERNEH